MFAPDGTAHEVPDDQAQAAYQSGRFGVQKDATVPVVDPSGSVVGVKGGDFAQALSAGARLATTQEAHEAYLEEKHGGIGGTLAAAGEGILRGATLGGSDLIAAGTGLKGVREHLQEEKDAHPLASIGGELVGAIAPSLFSGGAGAVAEGANLARAGVEGAELASAGAKAFSVARAAEQGAGLLGGAARAAGAPIRAVSALGGGVERAAGALLGDSRLARYAAKGAGMAAEGAAFGGAQEIDESVLGDHELNAEKILAAMGHGALAGGALGVGGHAVSEAATAGLRRLAPKLEEWSGEQAWKALGATKAITKEAEVRGGGISAVGRTLLEEDVVPRTPGVRGVVDSMLTPEEMLPRIQEARQRIGSQIGDVTANSNATTKLSEVVEALDKTIAPLRQKAGFEGVVNSLDGYRESLLSKFAPHATAEGVTSLDGKIPIRDLIAQRQALDDLVYKEAKSLDPNLRVSFLREIRGNLQGLELGAIDRAAEQMGGPGAKELRELNKKYQHLSLAEKAATETQAANKTNRNFSLTDYLSAGSALAGGHPLAAPVVAFGHRFMRQRWNAMAAAAADKIASMNVIQRAVGTVDRQIDANVSRFFNAERRATQARIRFSRPSETKESARERYPERVEDVRKLTAAPAVKADAIAKHLNGIDAHAPNTVKAVAERTQAATDFMASKLPSGHLDPNSLTPHLERPRVSDAEMTRFMRYADAVDNPLSVVADLKDGRISREGVEVLQKVYPKMYQQVRESIQSGLAGLKKPLPYNETVQLGVLLNMPTHRTLTPTFLADAQATFANKGADKSGGGGGMPKRPISNPGQGLGLRFGSGNGE